MADNYCTPDDVRLQYGQAFIDEYADLDNDEDPAVIEERVTLACTRASGYINNRLKGAGYTIPFEVPVLDDEIKIHAALLAGVFLYEAKGVDRETDDAGDGAHDYSMNKKRVDQWIKDVRNSVVQLSVERSYSRTPQIINED